MPNLTGQLLHEGAIVNVSIGLGQRDLQTLRRALRPILQPTQLRALIDTGAEVTCLDPAIISTLALPWEKPTLANMPGGIGFSVSTLHRAGLTILHPSGDPAQNLVLQEILVCDLPLNMLGYDVVLGRDVLDLVHFHYNGPARTFSLDY